jgi:hypothetical protein
MLSSSGIDTPSAGSQQDPPLFSNNSFNSQVRLKAEYFLSILINSENFHSFFDSHLRGTRYLLAQMSFLI